jgi:hypothetical protein
VQVQLPLRPGESGPDGLRRLERMLELGWPGWRERLVWRPHGMANGRTGALDLPGQTWWDRPAVDRGDGAFLAGDMVAAPRLLSEVVFHSALRRLAPTFSAAPCPVMGGPHPSGDHLRSRPTEVCPRGVSSRIRFAPNSITISRW